jgi:thiopeptide-type bacteriocin biosynthesis protein
LDKFQPGHGALGYHPEYEQGQVSSILPFSGITREKSRWIACQPIYFLLQEMMKDAGLRFPPGSDWLYLRIYGGPQALEEWLTGHLSSMLPVWMESGWVNLFHFVHFLDPEYHLRLRLRLCDPYHAGEIMNRIQLSCSVMLTEDLIWKIEIGTYEPEYERYGAERMPMVEEWFGIDSLFWLDESVRGESGEDPEVWRTAMRSVDVLMNDFGATIDDKIKIISGLKKSTVSLVRLNKTMKGQLDEKYRKMAVDINLLIQSGCPVSEGSLFRRSEDGSSVVRQLQNSFPDGSLLDSDLLPNLIHMSLNRAFRTRHRLQELVVYDFLSRCYESMQARAKKVTSDPRLRGGRLSDK